jgi:hypothetical protein
MSKIITIKVLDKRVIVVGGSVMYIILKWIRM